MLDLSRTTFSTCTAPPNPTWDLYEGELQFKYCIYFCPINIFLGSALCPFGRNMAVLGFYFGNVMTWLGMFLTCMVCIGIIFVQYLHLFVFCLSAASGPFWGPKVAYK